MTLRAGTHRIGPGDGTLRVRTYREGVAQKAGHDLVLEVGRWEATVRVREDGAPEAVELTADPRSLQVREALHGVKPLTGKDRADIGRTIDEKLLRGRRIAFRSSAVEYADGRLVVQGELDLAGARRQARFELDATPDGRVAGTLPLTQTEWGIKPYRGLMGALKVRDTVEVVVDVALPAA